MDFETLVPYIITGIFSALIPKRGEVAIEKIRGRYKVEEVTVTSNSEAGLELAKADAQIRVKDRDQVYQMLADMRNDLNEAQREISVLQNDKITLTAQTKILTNEKDTWDKDRQQWRMERELWQTERTAWQLDREQWRAERDAWQTERSAWQLEKESLQKRLRVLENKLFNRPLTDPK